MPPSSETSFSFGLFVWFVCWFVGVCMHSWWGFACLLGCFLFSTRCAYESRNKHHQQAWETLELEDLATASRSFLKSRGKQEIKRESDLHSAQTYRYFPTTGGFVEAAPRSQGPASRELEVEGTTGDRTRIQVFFFFFFFSGVLFVQGGRFFFGAGCRKSFARWLVESFLTASFETDILKEGLEPYGFCRFAARRFGRRGSIWVFWVGGQWARYGFFF